MSIEHVMRAIEGPGFSAEASIASDLLTFQRVIRDHPTARRLLKYMASPDAQEVVLNRVLSLSRQSPDPRYENPADTPLSVYVWALSAYDYSLARIAAQAISETLQCWWARAIAEQVLLGSNVQSSAGADLLDVAVGGRPRVTAGQTDGAGETVITSGLGRGIGRRITVWSKKIRTINEGALAA